MKIEFGGHDLELRCSGTLWWPEESLLVASDLHLEKGSSFLSKGFFLPPHDTRDTLERLAGEIDALKPSTLILLGDSFHDHKAFDRLNRHDRELFVSVLKSQHTVWIVGNHDALYLPNGIAAHDEFAHGPFMFRHEAGGEGFEISGHYHPAASFRHKGHKVGGRCFAVSDTRLIMPSFGSYTGGLDVFDPAISQWLGEDFTVHFCLHRRVFALKASQFSD